MSLEVWQRIAENLSEKRSVSQTDIVISFLTKKLFQAPDHYSDDNLEYYYSVKEHNFYTREHHWDGGNMWSDHLGNKTILTKEQMKEELEGRKRIALRDIADTEKEAFHKTYDIIERMLLGWAE